MTQLYLPRHTLLLSEDKTYPGMVTAYDEETKRVTIVWWKWGYDAPPTERIIDNAFASDRESQVTTLNTIVNRFGLPPGYEAALNTLHLGLILRTIKAMFWDPNPFVHLDLNADDSFSIVVEGPGLDDEPEEIITGDKIEDLVEHVVYWLNDDELPD